MGKRFLEAPIRTILNNYRPVQKFIIFCFYIYSSVEKSSDKILRLILILLIIKV